jgi:Cu+-exporting ATPase
VIDVAATREVVLDIEGMTCASCVQKVERALGGVDGVDAAAVNLATRTATVRGDVPGPDALIVAVSRAGYGARPHDDARDPAEEEAARSPGPTRSTTCRTRPTGSGAGASARTAPTTT